MFYVQRLEQEKKSITSSKNDNDVSVLLRDWDIERFFVNNQNKDSPPKQLLKQSASHANITNASHTKPEIFNYPVAIGAVEIRRKDVPILTVNDKKKNTSAPAATASQQSQQSQPQPSKPKHSFLLNFLDKDSNKVHKRQESDSKLSLNFVRGFRRENTDFFPLSKRHSAILGDRQATAAVLAAATPQRASVIYPKNYKNSGEPILTDFISREYNLDNNNTQPMTTAKTASSTSIASSITANINNSNIANNININNNRNNQSRGSFFLGPRREKTESVILRNSTTRQLLLDQQQVNNKQTKQKHTQYQNETFFIALTSLLHFFFSNT